MRVAIFIDGKNFYSGWRDMAAGRKIDFSLLAKWLCNEVSGTSFVAAHYYTGVEEEANELPETQGKLNKFLSFIQNQRGFFVKRFPRKQHSMKCGHCHGDLSFTREKEVDTTMVADMVRMAAMNTFDIAILLSGDADYIPAIESINMLGKQAWIASWDGSGLSSRIREVAFDHINLVSGLHSFEYFEDAKANSCKGYANLENVFPENAFSHKDSQAAISFRNFLPPKEMQDNGAISDEAFLEELIRAEEHFAQKKDHSNGGYVGLGYFITKWRSSSLTTSAEQRRVILDRLVESGKVIVYGAPQGYQGIKTNLSES